MDFWQLNGKIQKKMSSQIVPEEVKSYCFMPVVAVRILVLVPSNCACWLRFAKLITKWNIRAAIVISMWGMMRFSLCSQFLFLIVDVVGTLMLVASGCVCGIMYLGWSGWLLIDLTGKQKMSSQTITKSRE